MIDYDTEQADSQEEDKISEDCRANNFVQEKNSVNFSSQ